VTDHGQYFEKVYNISDRRLGSGACGEVYMAIEQSRHAQLACKIVDLRRLKSSPQTTLGRSDSAAAAGAFSNRVQMANIKPWAERKHQENRFEQQLRVYHREASILASLSHVSKSHSSISLGETLTCLAAKHHWYRKSIHHE
jgi:hypothetical protein